MIHHHLFFFKSHVVGWGSANTNGFNQPGGGYQSSDSFFNEPPSYGGMASSGSSGNQTAQVGSIKHKILTLVHAIRTLLRIPLIFLNIVIIVYELIAG